MREQIFTLLVYQQRHCSPHLEQVPTFHRHSATQYLTHFSLYLGQMDAMLAWNIGSMGTLMSLLMRQRCEYNATYILSSKHSMPCTNSFNSSLLSHSSIAQPSGLIFHLFHKNNYFYPCCIHIFTYIKFTFFHFPSA